MIVKTALLVLTNPHHVSKILPSVRRQISKTLYIHLANGRNPAHVYQSEVLSDPPQYSQTIHSVYTQANKYCSDIDVRVLLSKILRPSTETIDTQLDIDLVIFDKQFSENETSAFIRRVSRRTNPCESVVLNNQDSLDTLLFDDGQVFKHVAVGGTFDQLHIGHKLLLTESILRASKKLTIGVTDVNLIKSKVLWEMIAPCSTRIQLVEDFVKDVCPFMEYNIVPIQDPYGPTKSDKSIEMLVVSEETTKGGDNCNKIRTENGLEPLHIHVIRLLDSSDRKNLEEEKISSSTRRMRMLGELHKPLKEKNLIQPPYIIGLTGPIASGKSKVAEMLESLGAAVINCDKLGHKAYIKGSKCHAEVVQNFGPNVLDCNGEIDRRVLGSMVFGNTEKLQLLNSIVWPAIAHLVQSNIAELRKAKRDVIVVEASVLLVAGWQDFCHEVWTCFVSPNESVRRVMERNGFSEEEARRRLDSQLSNSEYISQADVLISTEWPLEHTRIVVEKAWGLLQKRIGINTNTKT